MNPFPHISHLNGFDPVWVRMWIVSLLPSVNPFSHISHLNGFDPVCVWICLLSWLDCLNPFYIIHIWITFFCGELPSDVKVFQQPATIRLLDLCFIYSPFFLIVFDDEDRFVIKNKLCTYTKKSCDEIKILKEPLFMKSAKLLNISK